VSKEEMNSHPRMLGHGNESQIGAALSMDDLLNEGIVWKSTCSKSIAKNVV
jgi:hypothetical protein